MGFSGRLAPSCQSSEETAFPADGSSSPPSGRRDPTDFPVERRYSVGGFCPFCEGHEDKTPPEVAALRQRSAAGEPSGLARARRHEPVPRASARRAARGRRRPGLPGHDRLRRPRSHHRKPAAHPVAQRDGRRGRHGRAAHLPAAPREHAPGQPVPVRHDFQERRLGGRRHGGAFAFPDDRHAGGAGDRPHRGAPRAAVQRRGRRVPFLQHD